MTQDDKILINEYTKQLVAKLIPTMKKLIKEELRASGNNSSRQAINESKAFKFTSADAQGFGMLNNNQMHTNSAPVRIPAHVEDIETGGDSILANKAMLQAAGLDKILSKDYSKMFKKKV